MSSSVSSSRSSSPVLTCSLQIEEEDDIITGSHEKETNAVSDSRLPGAWSMRIPPEFAWLTSPETMKFPNTTEWCHETAHRVFTFVLYGRAKKYHDGFVANTKIIARDFPEFEIWLFVGDDIPQSRMNVYMQLPNVTMIQQYPIHDNRLFMCRVLAFENKNVQFMIARDADSRIHDRDQWCIREFVSFCRNLSSDGGDGGESEQTCVCESREKVEPATPPHSPLHVECLHIVRDHVLHRSRVMGGMFALYRNTGASELQLHSRFADWIQGRTFSYGSDEQFLAEALYKEFVMPEIMTVKEEEEEEGQEGEENDKVGSFSRPVRRVLLHTSLNVFADELLPRRIPVITHQCIRDCGLTSTNYTGFVGNVVEIDETTEEERFGFSYLDIMSEEALFAELQKQSQWHMILHLWEEEGLQHVVLNKYRSKDEPLVSIMTNVMCAYYYTEQYQKCLKYYDLYSQYHLPVARSVIIRNSDYFLLRWAALHDYTIVATTSYEWDSMSSPAWEDIYDRSQRLIVLCYGNYPHEASTHLPTTMNVLHNDYRQRQRILLQRHVHWYFEVDKEILRPPFSVSKSNLWARCMEVISTVYVLNLRTRYDRFLEIVGELCRMGIPLDKVHHIRGEPAATITGNDDGTSSTNVYVDRIYGAGDNHVKALRHFAAAAGSSPSMAMVFEDDVTFSPDIARHQEDLYMALFLPDTPPQPRHQRPLYVTTPAQHNFDILFLCYSQFGAVDVCNDFLCKTRQECTTSSAYVVSSHPEHGGLSTLLAVLEEGQAKLLETKDATTYACDRYWAKLQQPPERNRMYVLRRKWGYQRPGYSNITQQATCHFD